jgi:hypothetical protein
MCPILKKFSSTFQPYDEVVQVIKEILASKNGDNIRILEHLLQYGDYQFGKPIIGKDYLERTDGQRIDNLDVDIYILLQISNKMRDIHTYNDLLSDIIREKEAFPHVERSLHILSPWMVTIDSYSTNQSDSFDSEIANYLLETSINLESSMAIITMNKGQFDVSEGHCCQYLVNSRRIALEGEEKNTSIFKALGNYMKLRQCQGDWSGAVSFAEEAYNLAVDIYDPVHPQVQEAACWLIDCLIKKGDLSNAERFAEQTYANLKDIKNGMDQEGEQIADGAYCLADVISRQKDGDLIKAEGLARESICIKDRLHGARIDVGRNCRLLAKILEKQGELGDETKELLERSLAIFTRNEGPDGANTAIVNSSVGSFHYQLAMRCSTGHSKRTQLLLAKSYLDEAIRIETKTRNPTHPNRVAAASSLSTILHESKV